MGRGERERERLGVKKKEVWGSACGDQWWGGGEGGRRGVRRRRKREHIQRRGRGGRDPYCVHRHAMHALLAEGRKERRRRRLVDFFFFTLSITPGDAPLCINSSTIAAQFRAAAQCIAVEPSKEIALQFAPSLIKRDTSLMSPFDAA